MKETIKKLKELPFYGLKCLKVVTNTGELVSFNLNQQQIMVHEKIEEQKRTTGKVRVIILKSRKLGMSTYAAGRFIHLTSLNSHKRAAVITHVADSTNAIFRVYKRFFDNLPVWIKPNIKKNNAKELEFDTLDSSIKVATAGSAETGRGDTVHLLHCSEIAFWPNAEEIAAGLMRSVADVNGTEIIIESTATSVDTLFYRLWTDAEKGLNQYLPIFLPWTVDPTCSLTVPNGYLFESEDIDYQNKYNLTDEQLYWRKTTIRQLGEKKFANEYPISAAEAFSVFDTDSFISRENIVNARKRTIPLPAYRNMPLILGVDVASTGADNTCFVWRRGDCVEKYELFSKLKNEDVAEELVKVINRDKPSKIFIDGTGGYGAGVAAILRLRGHACEEIHFSSKSSNGECVNKRAEMYFNLREWLQREVSIPDDDIIESDLTAVGYKHNLNNLLQMEAKVDIKKRLGRSPDVADALVLTFAYDVGPEHVNNNWEKFRQRDELYAW